MQRAFIDAKQNELERWEPPRVDADWHGLCQAIYKGIEGDEWEELYLSLQRVETRRQEPKKPSESEKAKALWAVKAARDGSEEFCDPARKEDIQGRTKTRLGLWEEHLKDLVAALAKALECLEAAYLGWHLVSQFVVANFCRRNGF